MTAPGPLGDEARALVEAARDWAARTFPDLDGHLATGAPECQWCPVCRAVAALRAPETADRVAGAVTAAAGAVAAVLDAITTPPTRDPGSVPRDPGTESTAAPGSGTDPAVRSYDIPVDGDA